MEDQYRYLFLPMHTTWICVKSSEFSSNCSGPQTLWSGEQFHKAVWSCSIRNTQAVVLGTQAVMANVVAVTTLRKLFL